MKILHLTTFLQGGAGRIITELAREQQQLGHDVLVVTSRHGAPGYGNYEEYLDTLSSLGIRTELVTSTFERTHRATIAAVSAVSRLLAPGHEPDVIHAHAAVPSLIGMLLTGARRSPTRVVQTMHGWGQTKTAEQEASDVAVLNLVDRVAVPSRHSAALIETLGVRSSQIAVVPYGVRPVATELEDRDRTAWVAMARARRAGRPVMACVGTIGPRKNQTRLVEALGRIDHLRPLCVFIGDGDDQPLREAAARYGCLDAIYLHGYSRSARALAAGADLLVLPSKSEGQPISLLEAFCDGVIVAVSDIPELRELVDDDATGFVFHSDDAGSLSATLERVAGLSNSRRRAIRAAARERFASQFTLSGMVERYMELYGPVIRNRSLPRRRMTRPAA
jgi:glycosyltransferase involved in cell wall biosynthesis